MYKYTASHSLCYIKTLEIKDVKQIYNLLKFMVAIYDYFNNKGHKNTSNLQEWLHLYNTILEPLEPKGIFLIIDSKYRYL